MINLTQHVATPAQVYAGVIDLPEAVAESIRNLLTVDERPTRGEIATRANAIVVVARNYCEAYNLDKSAIIGGAPWLMSSLERALKRHGLKAYYAFSKRESTDVIQPDGSVRKMQVFNHAGFVPA